MVRATFGGDETQGVRETVVVRGSEDEARRVYADQVASAADNEYRQVRLTNAGSDVELWPPATGWTS
ncbi:hypothetical protein H7K45_29525 [Mycobacterium yunnanensis]|uniref:Uncharacterized protein n=1 Tax=Mycobacterium yunnanensis TaxID=368477 RepID=A0A9X2ZA98_9MYCO|nr:hypothetical protein [Mycobacterium yunnanensis]